VILRTSTKSDLTTIVSFNTAMAKETEGKSLADTAIRPGVLALLEDPSKGFYVLAEENSEIIGQLMVTREWSDWRNGDFWWIQSVYVLPEFRGKGVYRAMHEKIINMAETEDKVCGIRLYVDKDNSSAQEVYNKLGMEKSHYVMFEEDWSKK
jgi:ribosomal protein S18 acetylase RimI-like enzyme